MVGGLSVVHTKFNSYWTNCWFGGLLSGLRRWSSAFCGLRTLVGRLVVVSLFSRSRIFSVVRGPLVVSVAHGIKRRWKGLISSDKEHQLAEGYERRGSTQPSQKATFSIKVFGHIGTFGQSKKGSKNIHSQFKCQCIYGS